MLCLLEVCSRRMFVSVDVWLMLMFGSFERYVGCSVRLDLLEIRGCFGWMFGSFGHLFRFEFCFGSMVVPVGFVFRLYAAILKVLSAS